MKCGRLFPLVKELGADKNRLPSAASRILIKWKWFNSRHLVFWSPVPPFAPFGCWSILLAGSLICSLSPSHSHSLALSRSFFLPVVVLVCFDLDPSSSSNFFLSLLYPFFATFLRVPSLPPTSHLPPILNRYIPPTTTVLPASARSSCKFCHRQRSMLSASDHCMSLDETNHSQPLSIHNCNHKNLSWNNKDSADVTNPRPT